MLTDGIGEGDALTVVKVMKDLKKVTAAGCSWTCRMVAGCGWFQCYLDKQAKLHLKIRISECPDFFFTNAENLSELLVFSIVVTG